jgi:hypothetical protein
VKTMLVTAYLSVFAKRYRYAVMLLGCLTTATMAQEPSGTPTADAPIYRVGDTWTILFGKTAVTETVISVTEKQTRMSKTIKGGRPSELDFDEQGCVTRTNSTTYEPSLGSLSFPMTVGKTWDSHWIVRDSNGAHETDAHVQVEAFERVEVAAGSFDAFKIAMRGVSAWNETKLSQAPWVATFWYAPSVKRVVKSIAEFYQYHSSRTETYELSEFSLVP